MKNLLAIALLLIPSVVFGAWDDGTAVKSGVISRIDVTTGTNYGFRVYLDGDPVMCRGGDRWAYLNETDSNYSVYISVLLAAKATGSTVTIYSNTLSGSTHCNIGYIAYQ